MDLLEIDPKLFITCRLCLEDTGVYQIVPTVQQQIKYCFDINVEPFDGLPQLLCKKCHTLLSEYAIVKKIFIEKQVTLKDKLTLKKEEPPEESVATENNKLNASAHGEAISGHNEVNGCNGVNLSAHSEANVSAHSEVNISAHREVNATAQKKKFPKSKRRKRLLSTSSTDSVNSTKTLKKDRKNTPKNSSNKGCAIWKKKYTKYFVCKICSLMYKDKKSIKKHYYSHSYLRAKHRNVFDVKCTVNLPKLDNKPNITGLNNAVVFSKTRIVQDDNSDSYNILYIAKSRQFSKSDSSDCEVFVSSKQRKRRRLDSLSSNETVLLGNNNVSPEIFDTKVSIKGTKPKNQSNDLRESKDTPICIDLDDSSDSNMDASKDTKPNNFNTLKLDMRTIENIVTVCRNKYEMRLKKSQLTENNSRAQIDSQLKHKLLTFGRKTINVKGFHNTGLLRYLEHKNLNVLWEPVSLKKAQLAGRDHSFVRVGATVINNEQRNDEDAGWIDVVGPTLDKEPCDTVNQCAPVVSNAAILIPTGSSVVITSTESDSVNQIVLSDIRSIEENNSKKLLNQNPVANPKQLPRKTYTHDNSKLLVTKRHNNFDQNPGEEIYESNLVMPVITSTKSLAAEVNNETKKTDTETENAVSNSVGDKTVARIKVKPVSELMNPQNIIPTTNHHNPLWNYNQIQNGTEGQENMVNLFVPNTLVSQIQSQSMPMLPVGTLMTEAPKSNSDYIILDTVDMPNTKTESPFEYFRNLLQLHGFLIEANADITRDYVCLLKFKVQFKQENKSNPVTLCLSLHCTGNKFCMSIKDGNQINIHIAKMSANWQWEIIKVYQGDVSTKILHNAQKAGQNVYTNTNTFLCLLKSITHKQEK